MLLRLASFAALLSFASLAAAQSPAYRTPLLNAGDHPDFVASGDLDGDGLTDLVTSSWSKVFVVRQVAPGEYAAPVMAAEQDWITLPVLADLDLDGDLDVAAPVNFGNPDFEDFVGVLLGGGDGTLAAPELLYTASGPSDLAIADMNGDGAPDLVAPGVATTRISVFLGHGDGTFEPKADVSAGMSPYKIDVDLVNADDDLDIVAVSSGGLCKTLAGDGAGGLTEVASVSIGSTVREFSLGRVDSNGDVDALAVLAGVAQFRVLLGDGAAGFVPQPPVIVPNSMLDGELADLDEDGDDDVVILLDGIGQVPQWTGFIVRLSNGHGTFGEQVAYGTDRTPSDLAVADLNHDGDLDLLATFPLSLYPYTGMLLPGRGDGSFGPLLRTGDKPEDAALGDLDGDGVPELVVACGDGDEVAVHAGLGHGAFGPPALTGMGQNPVEVVVADVFEDGLLDVVVANLWTPGFVTASPGDGALGLGAGVLSPAGGSPAGMAAGDVNLDGHIDLALACTNSPGTGRLLLGNGAGTFAFADIVQAGSSPESCALGDLNADGWLDLVISPHSTEVTVALGDGTGLFGPTTSATVPYFNQHDVALGDLDGDDDLDVVSSGGNAGGLNLLLNDGSGALQATPGLPYDDNWSVAIADVNGDDIADVLNTAENSPVVGGFGSLAVWPGLGRGAFGSPVVTNVAVFTKELLVADLDGDGAPEAIAFAIEDDDLWVLRNTQGPWLDLGQPLAGVQGLPRQQGFGALQSGEPFEFLLTDARPNGSAWHVVGLSAIDAPFKGGVLVPAPLLLIGPFVLDAEGDLSIAGPWLGAAAPGLEMYLQFWIQDPAGVKGWSASNALRATVP